MLATATEYVHEAAPQVEEKTRNGVEKFLRKMEMTGAQATGMQPAQTMARLKGFAIGLVVVGVTLTVGLKITSSVKSNINDTEAQTGATDAINGLKELSGFLPIIGLVVAAAAVIGLVSGGFSNGGRRGRA